MIYKSQPVHDNLRQLGLTRKLIRRAAAELNGTMNCVPIGCTTFWALILRNRYCCASCWRLGQWRGVFWLYCQRFGMSFLFEVRSQIYWPSFLKITCTNPYPESNSVFIMDNRSTHKSNAVREVIEAAGRRLVFLPPYSPDFSPIEESFRCGMIFLIPSVASHSLPYL